ncbi:response regulator [Desulfogranum japonicum]|uniref:response regulator n=1 Tax=Desulfogranum japonicum TaxID=231447 RepID=UPI00041364A1|nr:response regulator [Desulfogranum japonicum]
MYGHTPAINELAENQEYMNASRILIIDDEQAILDSFQEYLEDYGYEILTAHNGRQGLELAHSEQPDLILVDLRMPKVGGLEVLAQVSSFSPMTPMIVVSGTGSVGDAAEALHNGAWDYLLKPVEDLSLLLHAVETALEKSRLQKENLEYKEYLEKLVEERTAELKQANVHLEQFNQRLRDIVETIRALSSCNEIQAFGELLLKEFSMHMQAADGSLYLRETNGFRLIHTLEGGDAARFIPFPLAEQSVFSRAFEENRPFLQKNIGQDTSVFPHGLKGGESECALVFPLPDEEKGIAAIIMFNNRSGSAFGEQDIEIGNILVSYSSKALGAVKANEQLAENEKRLRQILDILPVGIFIVDVETETIQYTNPYAASLLGKQSTGIVGHTYTDVLQAQRVSGSSEKSDPAEQLLLHVNGREVVVLREVSLAKIEGRESYIECIIDISEQIKAEEEKEALQKQLLHADKMEALGTLAGGVAHDFNNILSAVIGFADLGLLELHDQATSIYGKLESIKAAAQRAKDLVEQIRAFSRMQQQMQIPMNIVPVVREVTQLLKSSLPADISIKTNLKTRRSIVGDPTQIHQIIMNLCTNSYHAMQTSGGVLSITVEEIEIEKQQLSMLPNLEQGGYIRMSIADTGTGIDPEIVGRIFEPYFTTKEKIKGTGLGLAIVHSIVRQHKGEITVDSTPGEGTVFHVYLPVSEAAVTEVAQSGQKIPSGTEHVLVVDDEETLVQITTELLYHLGYKVTGVVESVKALELFKQDPDRFDIVLSDYDMPDLKGMQLALEIHNLRPELPIMLCSGYTDKIDPARATALGIRKILNKPLSLDTLGYAIREVLDS